jgi:hypothetical protein
MEKQSINNKERNAAGVWDVGNWKFWASGLLDNQFDVWLRAQNKLMIINTPGAFPIVRMGGGCLGEQFGDCWVQDEGDLLIAQRQVADDEQIDEILAEKKIRAEMKGSGAPEIDVKKWLNPPAEDSLEKLRGKVVLLFFWRGAPGNPLPKAEGIYQQYKKQGLVVIGLHPDINTDNLGLAVKNGHVEMPVGIDTGETAKRYAAGTHQGAYLSVLIGKDGKVIQYGGQVNKDQLDALLK